MFTIVDSAPSPHHPKAHVLPWKRRTNGIRVRQFLFMCGRVCVPRSVCVERRWTQVFGYLVSEIWFSVFRFSSFDVVGASRFLFLTVGWCQRARRQKANISDGVKTVICKTRAKNRSFFNLEKVWSQKC